MRIESFPARIRVQLAIGTGPTRETGELINLSPNKPTSPHGKFWTSQAPPPTSPHGEAELTPREAPELTPRGARAYLPKAKNISNPCVFASQAPKTQWRLQLCKDCPFRTKTPTTHAHHAVRSATADDFRLCMLIGCCKRKDSPKRNAVMRPPPLRVFQATAFWLPHREGLKTDPK